MLETELKSIITEEIYEKVKNSFLWDSSYEQINYYYGDTNGILRKERITVRVREKNGVFKLQIKQHKNSGGALQICEETECDIDGVPKMLDAKTALSVTGINCGDLFLIGKASTVRSSLMWDSNTEICLDKTSYFDIIDYEIEVEYTDKIKTELMEKLSSFGIGFQEDTKGKFSRFLAEYKRLGNSCNS